MRLYETKTPGEKKLELEGFVFYYMSADSAKIPKREDGIRDHTAQDLAEEFIELCKGSSENTDEAMVHLHHHPMKHSTEKGDRYFHFRREGSMRTVFHISK